MFDSVEHDERHIRINLLLPVVEVDDHPVNRLHQVVECLLYALLQREELALVGTRIVALALAGSGAHQVGVDVVGIALHVVALGDIIAVVASVLRGVSDQGRCRGDLRRQGRSRDLPRGQAHRRGRHRAEDAGRPVPGRPLELNRTMKKWSAPFCGERSLFWFIFA